MYGKLGAFVIVTLASLGAISVSQPAAAQQSGPVIVTGKPVDFAVRRVSYRDLNLAIAQDQQTLHKRVSFAVRDVCREATGQGATFYETINCESKSWLGAKPQMKQAINRASEMARYGHSDIPMVALQISAGF